MTRKPEGPPGGGYRLDRLKRRTRLSRKRLLLAALVLVLAAAASGLWWQLSGERLSARQGATVADVTTATTTATSTNTVPAGTKLARLPFQLLSFPAQPPSPPQKVKLPVLMFHHVGNVPPGADAIRRGLTVSASDFEAMMAYLAQAGYHPVSQTQLFQALFAGKPLPPMPVMITFDDGYLDVYTHAAPVLEQYGFPATFNVITDLVGRDGYMSWNQIEDLDGRGMDIGSHTCSHPDLATLSGAALRHQVSDAAVIIGLHLGHPVYWFCYPSGRYSDKVINYVRQSGYLLAYTTRAGKLQSSADPFAILRERVGPNTGLAGFKELLR